MVQYGSKEFVNGPISFNSDSVWSYELGEKWRSSDNRFSVNAAGYFESWIGVQQVNPLSCGYVYTANAGNAAAYGEDEFSRRTAERLCAAAGAARALLVFNGTAANVLGVSLLLRPYEGVICAESSHLNVDECGAAERVLGSKLLPVPTPDGKLTPDLVATRLGGRHDEHRAQPRAVCITQVTELGTCYSLPELRALGEFCRGQDLRLYIDGARLANAVAYLGCTVADIAAEADVVSFGGTKNGAVAAEVVLVMAGDLLDTLEGARRRRMRGSAAATAWPVPGWGGAPLGSKTDT